MKTFLFYRSFEGKDTQLSLKWVGLDDKKVKTDYCENCDTKELNKSNYVRSTISIINNSVGMRRSQEEEINLSEEERERFEEEEKRN